MRRLRVTIVLVFVLSVIAFIAYNVLARMVEDHTPPVITCDSDTVTVSVEDDDSALFQGMTAEDNRDGDLTDSIRVSSMSNFTEPGKRTANYAVFDSSNQVATYSRTVEYTDYTSPQIQLSEPLRFSMEQMEDINLAENMTVQDCLDGDISSQIRATFSDNAYISQAGNYEVTVQVSNSAGDTCSVPLTVTVTDSSVEILSINAGTVVLRNGTVLDGSACTTAADIFYWPTAGYTEGATLIIEDNDSRIIGPFGYSNDYDYAEEKYEGKTQADLYDDFISNTKVLIPSDYPYELNMISNEYFDYVTVDDSDNPGYSRILPILK